MTDIGVPGYLVASSVIAVLAQRLVRVVCPRCKQSHTPRETELREAGITPEMVADAEFAKGKGCPNCQQSGYRGRIGVYELMRMSSTIRDQAFAGASTQDIRRAAITDGMVTLYQDGIEKVLRGITTLPEVYRVAKRTEQD